MTSREHAIDHQGRAEDQAAIRQVVANFADAWNRHDPTAKVKDFAEDIDHISVRGRWQQSRAELEQTYLEYHAAVWKDVTYHPVVEKVRFMRPDVAVVIVQGTFRSASATDTARATWIMSKEDGRWLCCAFHQTYLQDVPIVPQGGDQP
jgi:uncharacterized protein (TIGR02246 family)